ncbi:LysR family transcriptional regulator [Shewanella sp. WXL01]|uniref:LysR family transcriptional regulator n=1 Tax=Shewanella maritima TaxID=2520507 RepID=A0A411PLB3_9GAMM|nr:MULTISPECIES: LysR family transcriptional regulator [Shewanella]NKF52637.1 LysR family transcriptional regulator [Shewanella sp. WXL01]QBF84317.1 LysR family transcriptional regulator [Shewanella maritima]
MELRHLKHFVTLAEYKSYSLAASELNISQPSLTRSIQRLESLLEAKLMERNSRFVKLTYFGNIVLKHSEKILSSVSDLEAEVKLPRDDSFNDIVLGGGNLVASHVYDSILVEFTRKYPNFNVELCYRYVEELYGLMLKGELDVFLAETRITQLDKMPDIDIIPYCESKGVFCCRPGHPLLKEKYLFTPRLKDYQIALPRGTPVEITSAFDDLFDTEREYFSGLVRFEEIHTIKHSLYNSDMICLLPDVIVKQELEAGRLVLLNINNMPQIDVAYGIVTMKGKPIKPAVKKFIEFVQTTAEHNS